MIAVLRMFHPLRIMRALIFIACSFVYASVFLHHATDAIEHPFYNWDGIGYVGSIISWYNSDPEQVYELTQKERRANVSDELYRQDFSCCFMSTEKAFTQRLLQYKVKPLYNAAVLALHLATHMSLTRSTELVSAYSFLLLGLFLWLWKRQFMPAELWMAGIIGMIYIFPFAMWSFPYFSTPDALCTFLCIAMLVSWLSWRSCALYVCFALLAIASRPDAMALTGLLTAYLTFVAREPYRFGRRKGGALIVALLADYWLVCNVSGHVDLEHWFLDTFILHTPFPADITMHLTFSTYWAIVYGSTEALLHTPRPQCMLIISAISIVFYAVNRLPQNRQNLHLMLIGWLSLAIRFMMFPAWGDDRYYFVYYLIILYSSGEIVAGCIYSVAKKILSRGKEISCEN